MSENQNNQTTTSSSLPLGSFNKEAPPLSAPEYNFSSAPETSPDPEPVDAHQAEVQELETSIDAYVKKTADRSHSYKETITLSSDQTSLANDQYQSQPSIILPITPEQEKKGQHQSPLTGLRWLVEWSKKLMKKFAGRFIYKKPPAISIPSKENNSVLSASIASTPKIELTPSTSTTSETMSTQTINNSTLEIETPLAS